MDHFTSTNNHLKNDAELYQSHQNSNITTMNRPDFHKNDLFVSTNIHNYEKENSFSESSSQSSLSNKPKSYNKNEKTDYENSFGPTVSKSNSLNNSKINSNLSN
jgi:hypothetical protein